jgi:putative regulatory protein, FmdB family
MPTYIYNCEKCGRTYEVVKPMSEAICPAYCERCGEQMIRVYGHVHFAFGAWKPTSAECTPENALAEARVAGFED